MDVCKCVECGCKAAELASQNPAFVQVLAVWGGIALVGIVGAIVMKWAYPGN